MPLDPATLAEIRRLSERRLSAAELAEYLAVPISTDERERMQALIDWFCRRYPTPLERLAYVRRATRRWRATQGAAFQR